MSSRGQSPWRSTVHRQANRPTPKGTHVKPLTRVFSPPRPGLPNRLCPTIGCLLFHPLGKHGPLVADGNTTTTAFSQMGATEAIQGTFSSATTGVTGTIGFLSQQSSSSVDPASSFTVSGGQSGAPYYQFIDGNGQTPDFTSLLLNPGKSYKFTASGVSNSHPFMIGESYGDMNSSLVNGGPLSGSGGSITVTMPIDFNGSLYYFCTNHSGMFQEFSIRRPTNLHPDRPPDFCRKPTHRQRSGGIQRHQSGCQLDFDLPLGQRSRGRKQFTLHP